MLLPVKLLQRSVYSCQRCEFEPSHPRRHCCVLKVTNSGLQLLLVLLTRRRGISKRRQPKLRRLCCAATRLAFTIVVVVVGLQAGRQAGICWRRSVENQEEEEEEEEEAVVVEVAGLCKSSLLVVVLEKLSSPVNPLIIISITYCYNSLSLDRPTDQSAMQQASDHMNPATAFPSLVTTTDSDCSTLIEQEADEPPSTKSPRLHEILNVYKRQGLCKSSLLVVVLEKLSSPVNPLIIISITYCYNSLSLDRPTDQSAMQQASDHMNPATAFPSLVTTTDSDCSTLIEQEADEPPSTKSPRLHEILNQSKAATVSRLARHAFYILQPCGHFIFFGF
ncbi:hypothetical protein T4D_6638 [Trichinella pseudospiralis]|uniref:Uncharacterized protein n=1 Tax=Trichinella pseudospiralis TaxID=6337 RepID=A0A0V1FU97_TRIPS|nr:hypothetical protein T4D_6638 [Trichinella pseudospiralis]